MNTETQNQPAAMTPEAFLNSLQDIVAKAAATVAMPAPAPTPGLEVKDSAALEVESKAAPMGKTADERTQGFVDPLRKSFEGLAMKGLHQLGADAVLANPAEYLKKASKAELDTIIMGMLTTQKGGMPFGEWVAKSGNQSIHIENAISHAVSNGSLPESVAKALDTTNGTALIRTDIEPALYEAYNKNFPLYRQIRTFPANGLVHSYDVKTALGTAGLVDDMEDLLTATNVNSQGTYVRRANANIAVMAARRAISFKQRFAVLQSGMNFNITGRDNLEVMDAFTAIAKLNQTQIFQGNYSTAGGTLSTEDGLYNTKGMDGFRTLLKAAGTSKTTDGTTKYYKDISRLVRAISDDGGDIENLILCLRNGALQAFEEELESIKQINITSAAQSSGVPMNTLTAGLRTFGDVMTRYIPIPGSAQGEGIGYYTLTATAREDVYLLDPAGFGLAYLGSPAPVVLELPSAYDNKLSSTYVIFAMNGLVVNIPQFHRKFRIAQQTL